MRKTLLYIALPFIFWQCQKDGKVEPVLVSVNTKLLSAQKWNIYKCTIGTPTTPKRSISQLATQTTGPYFTDFSFSYVIFKNDGTYSAMDVDKRLTENFMWEWAYNETEIVIKDPNTGKTKNIGVDNLESEKLTLRFNLKKGITSDDEWNSTASGLRANGLGVGFTEVYIIEDFLAAK